MIIAGKKGLMFSGVHYTPGQEVPGSALEKLGKSEVDRLRKGNNLRKVSDDPEEEVQHALRQHGKWNLSPATLKGKSLDDLNALLIERGADPTTTVRAAKKILSADYDPDLDLVGPSLNVG